jgi:hypothetical protein
MSSLKSSNLVTPFVYILMLLLEKYREPLRVLVSLMSWTLSGLNDSNDVSVRLKLDVRLKRFSRRRLRRDMRWVFLMLRPKNTYNINPTAGSSRSVVTHASDFTGLRFSERITATTPNMVTA